MAKPPLALITLPRMELLAPAYTATATPAPVLPVMMLPSSHR